MSWMVNPRFLHRPRRTPKRRGGFAVLFSGVWFGILLVASLVIPSSLGSARDHWVLDSANATTLATPYAVTPAGTRMGRRGSRWPISAIDVRYEDAKGKRHESRFETILPYLVAKARKGEAIEIQYSPDDPSIIRLPPTRGDRTAAIMKLAVVALCCVAGFAFFVSVVVAIRRRVSRAPE